MASLENNSNSRKLFWILVALTQILGAFVVIYLVVWECFFNKGYLWDFEYRQFAIHPLVMILSMVVLYGQGAISYRVLDFISRSKVKIIHMIIMGMALILAVFGIVTVFVFHAHMHYGNMYTLHSWCGMLTVVCFGIQFFFGFIFLLFTSVNGAATRIYTPIHRYGSFAILAMVASSIISGVVDYMMLAIGNNDYRSLNLHAVTFNIIGMTCLIIIIILMYLLYRDDWKRGNIAKSTDPESVSSAPAPPLPPTAPTEETGLLSDKSASSTLPPK